MALKPASLKSFMSDALAGLAEAYVDAVVFGQFDERSDVYVAPAGTEAFGVFAVALGIVIARVEAADVVEEASSGFAQVGGQGKADGEPVGVVGRDVDVRIEDAAYYGAGMVGGIVVGPKVWIKGVHTSVDNEVLVLMFDAIRISSGAM